VGLPRSLALLVSLGTSFGCGADAVVTLGRPDPVFAFEDEGKPVEGVNSSAEEQAPTLTSDLLEIYFTSDRDLAGLGDVWTATRASRADPFSEASPVAGVNTELREASPTIAADGLTLWVGSARPGSQGGTDIWQFSRQSRASSWSSDGVTLTNLNTAGDDLPRPVALGGRTLSYASKDPTRERYESFLAWRDTPGARFEDSDDIEPLPLGGEPPADAFLTEDGLFVFFSRRQGDAAGDLFVAWRIRPDEPFGEPVPLTTVNTAADERDPWVNSDGTRFFFSSDRRSSRAHDIYATPLELSRFD
jgi:hypothetical protein